MTVRGGNERIKGEVKLKRRKREWKKEGSACNATLQKNGSVEVCGSF
jgi:hypothetical protein